MILKIYIVNNCGGMTDLSTLDEEKSGDFFSQCAVTVKIPILQGVRQLRLYMNLDNQDFMLI